MNFDYRTQFEHYSNEELLRVVKQPEQYQEEAISAAKDILAEREVSNAELTAINVEVNRKRQQKEIKAETANTVKHIVSETLQLFTNPTKHPNKKANPVFWVVVIVAIRAGYYLWDLPGDIKSLSDILWMFSNSDEDLLFYSQILFFNILNIVYMPVLIYLLIMRKRWGWILFTFDAIAIITMHLGSFYSLIAYPEYTQFNIPWLIFNFATMIPLLFFLLKQEVYSYFNITKRSKQLTVIYSAVIATAFLLTLIFGGYI